MTEPEFPLQSDQVPEAIQRLLTTIDELRGELREIAYLRQDETIAFERLRKWEQRASTTLERLGARAEAERLRKAAGVIIMGDALASLRHRTEAKDAVLVSFRDELSKHPDFWLQEMAKVEATPAVVVSPTSRQIFLGHGHSQLWRRVLEHLRDELHLDVEAWESESRTGRYNNEVLKELLNKSGFAVMVVTGEDATAEGSTRARQNVVHEIGLFQGRLGFERVALLLQEGVEGFTNIAGLQYIPFTGGERIEQTFYELDRMLRREGLLK